MKGKTPAMPLPDHVLAAKGIGIFLDPVEGMQIYGGFPRDGTPPTE